LPLLKFQPSYYGTWIRSGLVSAGSFEESTETSSAKK